VLLTKPDGGPDRTILMDRVAISRLHGAPCCFRRGVGMPRGPVRLQDQDHHLTAVQVLDPAAAGQADNGGSWWPTFLLRVGMGCYGLQIDGARFSKVIVIDFRA